jgi:hypothetical protein
LSHSTKNLGQFKKMIPFFRDCKSYVRIDHLYWMGAADIICGSSGRGGDERSGVPVL